MAALIENHGGRPVLAPATREVPSGQDGAIASFVAALLQSKVDLIIFLTGVGARALVRAIEPFCSREQFISAVSRVPVLARGPKPVAALRELGVPVAWNVPEPNTWREILHVLEVNKVPLSGRRVAVQEYGVPSKELVQGLTGRGAEVISVHVYDWALPEDTQHMKDAIRALLDGRIHVVLFTAAVQVHHLLKVAVVLGSRDSVITALIRRGASW